MSRDLLYVAGAPGAGKSTLMRLLTVSCTRTPVTAPVPHDVLTVPNGGPDAVEIGRCRDTFAGTDALSMSIQPRAVEWITGERRRLVLAEGDRLANLGFLTAAHAAGYRVTLLILDVPGWMLDQRCAQRGSRQSAVWRAGRATKCERLAAAADAIGIAVRRLDARTEPAHVLAQAHAAVPALRLLRPRENSP